MKSIEKNGKKDMGDLKQDIIDAANTTKEIIQDQFRETRADSQAVAERAQGVAQGVAQEIKQAAINIARVVAAPGDPIDPIDPIKPVAPIGPVELNAHIRPETSIPGAYARSGSLPVDSEPMVHTLVSPGMPNATTQIIGVPSQTEVDLVMREVGIHETKN